MTVVAILFAVPTASLGWLVFVAFWAVALFIGQSSRRRSPFRRRLHQLLVLLQADAKGHETTLTRGTVRDRARQVAAEGFGGASRRWRGELGAIHAQGYQVASEAISSPMGAARGGELVRDAVLALKAERAGGGAVVPSAEDPVVVLAYGLGAWPEGADLTSLEELLAELGVSHGTLRSRFESLLRIVPTASRDREFRELAGASFVLGASARIVEAAAPPGGSVQPPGWLASLRAPRRRST